MPPKDPPKSRPASTHGKGRLIRPPNLVLTLDSTKIASDPGQDFTVECSYGVIFATGDYTGVEVGRSGLPVDWTPLLLGFPYRGDTNVPLRIRKNGMTGTLRLLGWDLGEYDDFETLTAILQMYAAGTTNGGPSAWPGPAASALNDADANPSTTRVGSNLLVWDFNTATWKRGAGSSSDTDGMTATVGALIARAWAMLYDTTAGGWARWRATPTNVDNLPQAALNGGTGQNAGVVNFPYLWEVGRGAFERARAIPATVAVTGRARVEDSFISGNVSASMSMAATGTKLTYTCPSNKVAEIGLMTIVTTAGTFTTGQWQIFYNGNVIATLAAGTILNNLNQGFGITLNAGETVSFSCAVAQAGITAQGEIFVKERWAE